MPTTTGQRRQHGKWAQTTSPLAQRLGKFFFPFISFFKLLTKTFSFLRFLPRYPILTQLLPPPQTCSDDNDIRWQVTTDVYYNTIGAPLYPGIEMSWNAEKSETTIGKDVLPGDLTKYLSEFFFSRFSRFSIYLTNVLLYIQVSICELRDVEGDNDDSGPTRPPPIMTITTTTTTITTTQTRPRPRRIQMRLWSPPLNTVASNSHNEDRDKGRDDDNGPRRRALGEFFSCFIYILD